MKFTGDLYGIDYTADLDFTGKPTQFHCFRENTSSIVWAFHFLNHKLKGGKGGTNIVKTTYTISRFLVK